MNLDFLAGERRKRAGTKRRAIEWGAVKQFLVTDVLSVAIATVLMVIFIVLLSVSMTGCAGPSAARTEVTPGESKIVSEREERRPSEATLKFRAAPPPPPPPVQPAPQLPRLHIHIPVPRTEPPPPPPPPPPSSPPSTGPEGAGYLDLG